MEKIFVCFTAMLTIALTACSGGGGGNEPEPATEYTVTVTTEGDGTVTVHPAKAAQGTEVTLKAIAGDNAILGAWRVESGGITLGEAATVTFTMPAQDVRIAAEFIIEDIFRVIPDPAFNLHCMLYDLDADGILSLEEARGVVSIRVFDTEIVSLEGIEYFTSLKELQCNQLSLLTALDVGKNTELAYFACSDTGLTSLDVSNNPALIYLNVSNCALDGLDVSRNTLLSTLNCNGCGLASIDLSKNDALKTLECNINALETLDLRQNKELESLRCGANRQLEELDLSQNAALATIDCSATAMTALDLRGCTLLTTLKAGPGLLETVDLSGNAQLQYLDVIDNKLTGLDISKNTALNTLTCSFNPGLYEIKVWSTFDTANPTASISTINKDAQATFVPVAR